MQAAKPAHYVLTIGRAQKQQSAFKLPTDLDEDSVLLPCLPTTVGESADPVTRHVSQVRCRWSCLKLLMLAELHNICNS